MAALSSPAAGTLKDKDNPLPLEVVVVLHVSIPSDEIPEGARVGIKGDHHLLSGGKGPWLDVMYLEHEDGNVWSTRFQIKTNQASVQFLIFLCDFGNLRLFFNVGRSISL